MVGTKHTTRPLLLPADSTVGEVDADASTFDEVVAGDPFDEFRQALCKTGAAMLDFLFDWLAGEHDKDVYNLCKKQAGSAIGLLAWAELEGEAASAWRGVLRQLGVHKSADALADGGQPDASSRSQKRMLTEEGSDETDDRAQEMRQERVETDTLSRAGCQGVRVTLVRALSGETLRGMECVRSVAVGDAA